MALDSRQDCDLLRRYVAEEVGQPVEDQAPLGLRRRREQNAHAAVARQDECGAPQRGLADARIPIDEQAGESVPGPLERAIDRLELRRAADDIGRDADLVHDATLEGYPDIGRLRAIAWPQR